MSKLNAFLIIYLWHDVNYKSLLFVIGSSVLKEISIITAIIITILIILILVVGFDMKALGYVWGS